MIVVGWRGHGTFRRLLAGSVSRSVAARAPCSVLVVREAGAPARRFVVGFDGSPNAERALEFLSSLERVRGSRVVLVHVVEPVSAPRSAGRLPASVRARVHREVASLNEEGSRKGRAILAAGAARLERSGWTVTGDLRMGDSLFNVLSAVTEHRADVLVLGARATSGLERALLGSVANGALNRSSVPVLLVQ